MTTAFELESVETIHIYKFRAPKTDTEFHVVKHSDLVPTGKIPFTLEEYKQSTKMGNAALMAKVKFPGSFVTPKKDLFDG